MMEKRYRPLFKESIACLECECQEDCSRNEEIQEADVTTAGRYIPQLGKDCPPNTNFLMKGSEFAQLNVKDPATGKVKPGKAPHNMCIAATTGGDVNCPPSIMKSGKPIDPTTCKVKESTGQTCLSECVLHR